MLQKVMGPNPELFKRTAMSFAGAGLFLVIAFALSDNLLAFATGSAVGSIIALIVLIVVSVGGLRLGLQRLAGLPTPWGRVIGIALASWIGAYILALIVGFLPAMLLGGWIVSLAQLVFFILLGSWLYLNWGQDDKASYQAAPEPVSAAPEPVAYGSPEPAPITPKYPEEDLEESRIQARREKLLSDAEVDDDLLSE